MDKILSLKRKVVCSNRPLSLFDRNFATSSVCYLFFCKQS